MKRTIMHIKPLIQKFLAGVTHKKRITLLTEILSGIFMCQQLKLSSVGRAIEGISDRSGIRKMDRMLSNKYFQEKTIIFYEAMSALILNGKKRPYVIVDWSKIPNTKHYILRASVAADGRALTLYEEEHPQKKHGNGAVHTQFLKNLKLVLPADCIPILITDSAFKNPWFRAVLKNGWDYVGRVRGVVKYKDDTKTELSSKLFSKATKTPKYLGKKFLSADKPLETAFYIFKQKLKNRHRYTKTGPIRVDKDSLNYARSQREPWLLVSSLQGHNMAEKVVKIYKTRMTIEESFRDLKSTQYGFSMELNITIQSARLVVWLLLAALAHLLAWIVGCVAEKNGMHRQFQANSTRNRRVLSLIYLGMQIIRKKINIPINLRNLQVAGEVKYFD